MSPDSQQHHDRLSTRHLLAAAALLVLGIHILSAVIATACHRRQLKTQLSDAVLRESEHRAESLSLFLNDCRNRLRMLLQSEAFQEHLRQSSLEQAEGADQSMHTILQRFITDSRQDRVTAFSHVLFVKRDVGFVEASSEDAPPWRLTMDFVRGLIGTLYVTPTLITHDGLEGRAPEMLLSSACMIGGKYQGQMLAWINPAALAAVVSGGPPVIGQSVFVQLEGDRVYAPPGSDITTWEQAAALSHSSAGLPVFFRLREGGRRRTMIGVRAPMVNSEYSLVVIRRAAVLSAAPARYWFPFLLSVCVLLLVALTLLPFRARLRSFLALLDLPGHGGPVGDSLEATASQTALRDVADAVLVTAANGDIEYANPAFEVITGYDAQDVLGQHPRFLKSGHHPDAFYRKFMAVLKRGDSWKGNIVNRRKDGSLYHARASVTPVHDAGGRLRHYVAVTADISAQMAAEERLRQSQKMEAIGELVGGVAHDFNNLITVIQGNCNLLLFSLGDLADGARDNIDEIMKASDRAASLTRRLLAFSRRRDAQPEVLELNEVIRNTEKMLHRLIREDIQIRIVTAGEPVCIEADLVQIEQLLINLAVNARDAMPAGGTLSITVACRHVSGHDSETSLPPGEYAALVVSDTGIGMDPRTRTKIFEPFFTTKHDKGGTGLGLATVNGIVRQHHGDVLVSSEPGKGTTFTILLPRREAARARAATAGENQPPPCTTPLVLSSSPTILVVDDEDSVLKMIQQSLETAGYIVYSARTDGELLKLWKRHCADIDLLLTDVVMPGMNGVDVAARLRQDRPELPVLYISAYTDSALLQSGATHSELEFLAKPFTPGILQARVQALLQQPPSQAPAD